MENVKPPSPMKKAIEGLFENPTRLRVALSGLLLVGWYVGVHRSYAERIEAKSATLKADLDRLQLAREVEHLRKESERVQRRMPAKSDQSEWVAFVMQNVRSLPLKLVSLEPRSPLDIGVYKVVVLKMTVEGKYADLEKLLKSLETSPRLLRIDSVKISLAKATEVDVPVNPTLDMNLSILGIINIPEAEKIEAVKKAEKS